MPDKETSTLMIEVQEALTTAFRKDPVAVLTGIFTGDNQRDWDFLYAQDTYLRAPNSTKLRIIPASPISIYTENDPEWSEYDEMSEAEINLTNLYPSVTIREMAE
ncbi:DUF695 domain-containing protein [Duncaniella dubosii]|uniref:DUF695 domain-containing protein n=1 Tax=Duncaniella dubosii TaxID=2518971 RepID=UPI003F66EDF9